MLNKVLWQGRFREAMQLAGWSPRTIEGYTAELRPFFEFLEAEAVATLSAVTPDVVAAYRRHLFYLRSQGRPLSAATQSSRLCAVKAFLRYLAREHFLLVDPGARVTLPRIGRHLPRLLLSEAEIEVLLETPDVNEPLGLRDRAALETLYATAVRNSELRALLLDDVNLERRELHVRQGKGNKSRMVPLGEEAAYWLEVWLREGRAHLRPGAEERHVFLSWRGVPLTRESMAELVVRAGRAAGLSKKVTPHLLRHCCATHMLARGAGLRHLQELLGHASAASTQRYTRIEIGDLKAVLRRCHPRERRRPR